MTEERTFSERLSQVLRDWWEPDPAARDREILQASLEEWLGGAGIRALLAGVGQDRLVPPGAQVTLTARLTRWSRLQAERVRFFVDDAPVGDEPIDRGELVSLPYRCRSAGLHHVGFAAVDAAGEEGARASSSRLHVVSPDAKIAAVDAGLILDDDLRAVEAARRLVEHGWTIAWLDLPEDHRSEEIRAAVRRFGLPEGAVLSHPLEPGDFDPLGVDFRPVFLTHTLRTIRADGLPLVWVVSRGEGPWAKVRERFGREEDAARFSRVGMLGPEEVNEACATAEGRAALDDRAAAFGAASKGRSSEIGWRLDRMTGSEREEGQRFTVELDNRRARERVLDLVSAAQRSIHLQLYILEAGRFTDLLVERLCAQAASGVFVRLMVDALWSQESLLGLTNAVLDRLRGTPNLEVTASDPILEPERLEPIALRERDHRKLLVVDGRVAVVSGRNGGDAYYLGFDEVEIGPDTRHEAVPWVDAHVEIEGPLVARVQDVFAESWARNTGRAIPLDAATWPRLAPAGDAAGRLVVHRGVEGDADGLAAYEALLDGARRHVYLMNDFPVMSAVGAAVRRALARGVRVVFLTGCAVPRRADGSLLPGPLFRVLFEYMTKQRLEPLLVAGAEGYEVSTGALDNITLPGGVIRPYVHAKVVTADGEAASIGSANLDVTASYWEREANAVLEDPWVVGRLEAELEAMAARGHRLDVAGEYWQREARMRERTARLWPDLVYPA